MSSSTVSAEVEASRRKTGDEELRAMLDEHFPFPDLDFSSSSLDIRARRFRSFQEDNFERMTLQKLEAEIGLACEQFAKLYASFGDKDVVLDLDKQFEADIDEYVKRQLLLDDFDINEFPPTHPMLVASFDRISAQADKLIKAFTRRRA